MDLMEELRRQAQTVQQEHADQESRRGETRAAVETAMARTFKYFHELLKHLEVVKPANPTSYVIPHVGAFDGLAFQESFIDIRKKREGDVELYDKVHFFIRWGSQVALKLECSNPQQLQRIRDALWTCNVRYAEDEVRVQAAVQRAVFTIPRTIVTDVEVQASHEAGCVVFSTRNLVRLGPEDFKVPAGDAKKEVFDEVGRMLLGQRSNFARYRVFLTPGQKA